VATSACEQCGRNRVPDIAAPVALADALQALSPGLHCLLAADGNQSLAMAARGAGAATVLIGPEGGLAPNERALAQTRGFIACRMGPRVLRTETAGLAALAILQTVAGDFAS
jgi:16S rRNA (uracil1498-N3)-methyltransferase